MEGQLAMALQGRAVPALVAELVLALVDGHLDALQGRSGDVRAAHAQAHLPLAQAG